MKSVVLNSVMNGEEIVERGIKEYERVKKAAQEADKKEKVDPSVYTAGFIAALLTIGMEKEDAFLLGTKIMSKIILSELLNKLEIWATTNTLL